MKKRAFTKVAVFGSVAALGIAGCGGEAATSGGQAASSGAAASQTRGGPPSADLSAVAERLGVSESKLEKAMEATRPAAGSQPSADPTEALAKELGLDTDKVREAMQSGDAAGRPALRRRRGRAV